MSTTTAAKHNATRALSEALEGLEQRTANGPHAARAATLVQQVRETLVSGSPVGTMRAWFESHDGELVDTVQVGIDRADLWTPLQRKIETRGGRVYLSASRRDYEGCRVIVASSRTLIVSDGWHVVAYTLTPAEIVLELGVGE